MDTIPAADAPAPLLDAAATASADTSAQAEGTGENPAQADAAIEAAPEKVTPKKRVRRGPPSDGKPELRVTVLLTTSRLSSVDGQPLRRGRAVRVPERRLEALTAQGKVRKATDGEIAAAVGRAPLVDLA